MNFTVKTNTTYTYLVYHGIRYSKDYHRVKSSRYDIVLRPNILEFQMINVTASDKGFYLFGYHGARTGRHVFELKITNMTCPSSPIERVCAIAGSSPMLKLSFDFPVYYDTIDKPSYWRRNLSRFTSNQMHAHIQIYNVNREDESLYKLILITDLDRDTMQQLVSK
ncbi:unnamed protein product [Mytilus edulis]|uniref:Uncharacterized protein n=1 Tax=Mytilus edulis TaxID=6550 RepID=A0A8S3PR45_MYTED|nr:unnamed protein product [Mytilus edulis]